MADSADVLKGNASRFSDVPAGQWYTGYVNLATSLQFVSGYPDGTFKPNSNITMQEALTVLMRIAGYNDNLVGPWPLNYIAQGGKLDVTDDVAFAGAAPATRAAIAVMASNILDINVVYWDADKTKFVEDTKMVEVFHPTFEREYDEVEVPITVLEDKFGADVVNDVTVYSWGFDDFDEQELVLNYSDYFFESGSLQKCYELSSEMAAKYWISDSQYINTLGWMQVNLILNDDDEVVYVDVTSTNAYSDDVDVTSDGVDVDGKAVKLADNSRIWLDLGANQTAKIYYNEDKKAYLFDSVSWDNGNPYVFKTYNSSKDRIEVYANAGVGNIALKDKDIAIIKSGYFITPAALKDGELLNYAGTADSTATAVYVVTNFKQGELTKASSSKLTVDGKGLVYEEDGDTYYTNSGLNNFAQLGELADLDAAFGATIQYAACLGNPYDLRLIVFEGGATNTIYGIITDVKANIDGQVSAITVLGADGEEVEYTITKGDKVRPAYHNYDEMYYEYWTDDFDLSFGTYIEAKVSEDGTIETDDIKVLVNPVYYGEGEEWYYWAWSYDLEYYSPDGYGTDYVYSNTEWEYEGYGYDSIDINKNRIRLDGVYYTLTADTLVFQTTTTGDQFWYTTEGFDPVGEFDKAEVIDVADLMAADEITYGAAAAFIDNGVVKQLFLLDTDLNSTSNYGVLDDVEYRSGDWYGTLLGGSEYKMSNDASGIVDTCFFAYSISGGKLNPLGEGPIVFVAGSEGHWYVGWNPGELQNGEVLGYAQRGNVGSVSSSLIIVDGGSYANNYMINDDTVFYKVEDGKISEGDVYDIEEGVTPLVFITTDDPTDDILAYVFVLIDAELD